MTSLDTVKVNDPISLYQSGLCVVLDFSSKDLANLVPFIYSISNSTLNSAQVLFFYLNILDKSLSMESLEHILFTFYSTSSNENSFVVLQKFNPHFLETAPCVSMVYSNPSPRLDSIMAKRKSLNFQKCIICSPENSETSQPNINLKTFTFPDSPNDFTFKTWPKVIMGGSFDRVHSGHKVLLSMSLISASQELWIGLTVYNSRLLSKKSNKEIILSYRTRTNTILTIGSLIQPSVLIQIAPLIDCPLGPTITEADLDFLILSKETEKAGAIINQKRKEKNFKPLAEHVLGLIPENPTVAASNTLTARESELEPNIPISRPSISISQKLSSSYLRKRLISRCSLSRIYRQSPRTTISPLRPPLKIPEFPFQIDNFHPISKSPCTFYSISDFPTLIKVSEITKSIQGKSSRIKKPLQIIIFSPLPFTHISSSILQNTPFESFSSLFLSHLSMESVYLDFGLITDHFLLSNIFGNGNEITSLDSDSTSSSSHVDDQGKNFSWDPIYSFPHKQAKSDQIDPVVCIATPQHLYYPKHSSPYLWMKWLSFSNMTNSFNNEKYSSISLTTRESSFMSVVFRISTLLYIFGEFSSFQIIDKVSDSKSTKDSSVYILIVPKDTFWPQISWNLEIQRIPPPQTLNSTTTEGFKFVKSEIIKLVLVNQHQHQMRTIVHSSLDFIDDRSSLHVLIPSLLGVYPLSENWYPIILKIIMRQSIQWASGVENIFI